MGMTAAAGVSLVEIGRRRRVRSLPVRKGHSD
jgi:hypothetical protein